MVENATVHHMEWMVAVYYVVVGATIHNDWSHAKNANANFIGVVMCSARHVSVMLKCIRVNKVKKQKKEKEYLRIQH